MRFFKQVKIVPVSDNMLEKARIFSEEVLLTVGRQGRYKDTNQNDLAKNRQDHYVGKVAEEAVRQIFQELDREVQGPDYKIYQGRGKSWDSDLYVDGVPLAVKAQTTEMAKKFGLSWTFQASESRYDPILNKPNSWVCFVEFDQQNRQCYVYPPYQIQELTFAKPKLPKYWGTKLAVYRSSLPLFVSI
ncbi:MAG: hypothetical protein ACLFQP_00020 [Halothece sp.]